MNYANYIPCDDANGEGVRCTLFVSGCTHNCKGCFNKTAMKFNFGSKYSKEFEDKILKDLSSDYLSGLSILGGEPLHERNLTTVLDLCKRVKQEHPNKTIWLWTGYTLKEVTQDSNKVEILKYVDTLIDGKFVEELKDTSLKWRGSSNQQIINIKEIR